MSEANATAVAMSRFMLFPLEWIFLICNADAQTTRKHALRLT